MIKKLLLLLLTVFFLFEVYSQDFSNKGTDFWVTYPAHANGTSSVMGLYITSDQNATGTITVGTQTIPFTVTANNVTRKFIGGSNGDATNASVYLNTLEGVTKDAAIHITADKPVVAYSHIILSARSGATLLLPSNVWGREYVVPSYYSQSSNTPGYGTITIVAKDSNTVVQITPTAKSLNGQHNAGAAFNTPTLQPGEAYQIQFQNNADISGTKVESVSVGNSGCKKIAVFSSTTWSAFGCSGNLGSGDNLYQQLFPTGAWGKTFLTAPFKNRNFDLIRVYVTDPTTVVKKTENNQTITLTGLMNSFYEINTSNPTLIEADKPVSVVQYVTTQACNTLCSGNNLSACYADPEMIIVNPVEQTINNITVFSAHKNFVPPGQSNVDQCFLNIIIKTIAAPSFTINGSLPGGTFQPIPGTQYSYLQENVTGISFSNPVQTLKADSNFIAIAYGFGSVESYGYNAGTNVIDLTQGVVLQNQYVITNAQATCTDMTSDVFVKFSYQPTTMSWDFGNDANISPNGILGPYNNPAADSSFVDPTSGKTVYIYKLPSKITFKKSGAYTFKVHSNNPTSDGCTGTQESSYTINVVDAPKAAFTVNGTGCFTDKVSFTDSSKGYGRMLMHRIWTMGDLTSTTQQNPQKTYAAAGEYNVTLRAVNDLGCYDDTTVKVVVTPKPSINLSVSSPACINLPITLTNNSSIGFGTVAKWKWKFNNGTEDSSAVKQNYTETFGQSGAYTFELTAVSNSGCSKTDSVKVIVHPQPTAHFLLPEVCLDDASADFKDSSYFSEATNATLSYAWVFGDPSSNVLNASAQKDPKHKYNASGIYPITLTITSSDGCVDSKSRNLTVNGAVPKADFTLLNTGKTCSNQDVIIKNISTVDFGDITKVEIFWDQNDLSVKTVDETPALNKTYSHLYPTFYTAGSKTYTIRMRSYSGQSCLNEATKVITLYSLPQLSFPNMSGICLNANAIVLNAAKETAANAGTFAYTGKGITAPGGNFDPSAAGAGTHTITYSFTTLNGCVDSAKANIRVFALPVASFSVQAPTCDKNAVVFNNTSSSSEGNIKQWQWDFGDGKTLYAANGAASELYPSVGDYTVSLKVVSDSNCISAASAKTVKVAPLPVVDFDLPGNVCLPSAKANFVNKSSISDGTIATAGYTWSFGDGANSVMKDPVHYYGTGGTKNVQLKVTSSSGCTDSVSKALNTIYAQPKATIAVANTAGCVNENFNFSGTAQAANGNITAYHWAAANKTYNTQNITAAFSTAANYPVSFYFTDEKGCNSDTASQLIQINSYPSVADMPTLFVLEGGSIKLQPVVTGTVIDLVWSPALYLDSPNVMTPTSTPLKQITYTLEVTGQGDCMVTKSVTVKVLEAPFVPNVFSPNGDGINDTWIIEHLSSYPECTVEVFDRYGAMVFYSRGYPKAWDGKYNGKILLPGTYYYVIDPKRGRSKLTGSITVLK